MNRNQEIALDANIFGEILSNSINDNTSSQVELTQIYLLIEKFHEIAISNKWLKDIENLRSLASDHNLLNYFNQLFFRNSKIKYSEIRKSEDKEDYLYFIADSLPQKIIVTDKAENKKYKLNSYNKEQFLSNKYKNDCSLYRIPKKLEYKSKVVLKDFAFLGYYLKECSEIEFMDPYLLKPDYDSSLEFIMSILSQVNKGIKVRFYSSQEETFEPKYKKFCREIKNAKPGIDILPPLNYNNENNHDRFIVINKDEFSLRFTTSFNNIKKVGSAFITKKNFEIIIDTVREYEDS